MHMISRLLQPDSLPETCRLKVAHTEVAGILRRVVDKQTT